MSNTKIVGVITSTQLANTGITAGTYGGSDNSASFTVDAQGRVTSVSNIAWTSTSISGGFSTMQIFTSSGTFTVPSGITKMKVTVVGGGGGGVGQVFTPGSCCSPGSWGWSGGSSGTSSSFGPHVSATGGSGGAAAGGGVGTSPGNAINIPGGQGFLGSYSVGGSTILGPSSVGPGAPAVNYGVGGTSTRQPGNNSANAGAGGGGGSIKFITASANGIYSAQTITVTVGAGGAAGPYGTGSPASAGGPGIVIVEY